MQAERLVEGILTSRERSLGLLHPWKWQAEISLSEAPDRRVQVFFEFMRSLCAAMCLRLSLSLSLSLSLCLLCFGGWGIGNLCTPRFRAPLLLMPDFQRMGSAVAGCEALWRGPLDFFSLSLSL